MTHKDLKKFNLLDFQTKNNNSVMVDVLIVTYNHEKYISKAIDSVLMQHCDFNFRIIIGEDCSVDNTISICKNYRDKYPNKILLINNNKNLGLPTNYKNVFNASTAKYISIIEGDDYWTDPLKLQKQIDVLIKDNSIGLVHTGYNVLYENGIIKKGNLYINKKNLSGNICVNLLYNNFINPMTTCFKSEIIKKYIDFDYFIDKKYKTIDYSIWLEISLRTNIYYIDEITGVYRNIQTSVSNSKNPENIEQFFYTAFDVYDVFFKKYPEFIKLKKKVINKLYINIIDALTISENYNYTKKYIDKIHIFNIKSLLLKLALIDLRYLRLLKYFRIKMSDIKQMFFKKYFRS